MVNNLKVTEKTTTHFQNWLDAKRLQRRFIFGTKTGLAVVAGITAGVVTSGMGWNKINSNIKCK